MKTKAMRKRMIALALAAATIFGAGAPALGARAAETNALNGTVILEQPEKAIGEYREKAEQLFNTYLKFTPDEMNRFKIHRSEFNGESGYKDKVCILFKWDNALPSGDGYMNDEIYAMIDVNTGEVEYHKGSYRNYTNLTWEEFVQKVVEIAGAFKMELNREYIDGEVSQMSLDEMFNTWMNVKNVKTSAGLEGTAVPEEVENETADAYDDAIAQYVQSAFKKLTLGLLDNLPGPVKTVLEDPAEDLFNMLFGVKKEDGVDFAGKLEETTARIIKRIDDLEASFEKTVIDANSTTDFGSKLDNFQSAAAALRTKIKGVFNNKGYKTDDEKAVGIASLLGPMADIENNNLYITCNQATTVLNDTPDADAKDRNIFGLAYESAARKSLFRGEAIDRSTYFLVKRIDRYTKNVATLLELLKAHDRISRFTADEVKALSPDVRAEYDRIVGKTYTVRENIKMIMNNLILSEEANQTAEHKAIINCTAEYLNQGNRTAFINKDENAAGTAVKDTFLAKTNMDFYDNVGRCSCKYYEDNLKYLIKEQPLSAQNIKDLAAHATTMKKTIRQYLTDIGFDLESIQNNSFLPCGTYEDRWNGAGVEGFSIDKCTGTLQKRMIKKHADSRQIDHQEGIYDDQTQIVFLQK